MRNGTILSLLLLVSSSSGSFAAAGGGRTPLPIAAIENLKRFDPAMEARFSKRGDAERTWFSSPIGCSGSLTAFLKWVEAETCDDFARLAHLSFVAPWGGDSFVVVQAEGAPASDTLWVGCGLVWSQYPEFP